MDAVLPGLTAFGNKQIFSNPWNVFSALALLFELGNILQIIS